MTGFPPDVFERTPRDLLDAMYRAAKRVRGLK